MLCVFWTKCHRKLLFRNSLPADSTLTLHSIALVKIKSQLYFSFVINNKVGECMSLTQISVMKLAAIPTRRYSYGNTAAHWRRGEQRSMLCYGRCTSMGINSQVGCMSISFLGIYNILYECTLHSSWDTSSDIHFIQAQGRWKIIQMTSHVGWPMDTKSSSSWIWVLSPLNFNHKNSCRFIAKYS